MYPSFMQLSKNTNEILKYKMTPDGESITFALFEFLTLEALKTYIDITKLLTILITQSYILYNTQMRQDTAICTINFLQIKNTKL